MSAIYDTIGRSYRTTRRADPRVLSTLIRWLAVSPPATLCDVGAGSGNYTNALCDSGFRVLAVEPSETMRSQAPAREGVTWIKGSAEAIPIADAQAAAVVCTLAAHHFSDLASAAREMERICPDGPFVFFTFDPHRGEQQWFLRYFPQIQAADLAIFPAVEDFAATIGKVTGRVADVLDFPLPPDLVDHFMYAPWATPETYLDPSFRANTSGFAKADATLVEAQVALLAEDLATGRWDAEFGHFRVAKQNDAGFCFVRFRPRQRGRKWV